MVALEQQQALLLGVLVRAAGAAVSYAELREAGIEFPASLVSELELAGVAIERCYGHVHGQRQLAGVRLHRARDVGRAAGEDLESLSSHAPCSEWGRVRVYRRSVAAGLGEAAWAGLREATAIGSRATRKTLVARSAGRERASAVSRGERRASVREPVPHASDAGGLRAPAARLGRARRRLLAAVALITAAGAVAALVVAGVTGTGGRARRAIADQREHAPVVSAAATGRTHTPPPRQSASPPTPTSPALATELGARGHELLTAGSYSAAVPVLRSALVATGESVSGCLEPAAQDCLTYAYALYDLGRALRLGGHPAAAVPILQRRLQIDNQRSTVAFEFKLAHQQGG